jgi:hypothetical protein
MFSVRKELSLLTFHGFTAVPNKLTLGQVLHRVVRFSLVSTFPKILNVHIYPHVALTRKTNGRGLGTFPKSNAISEIPGEGGGDNV